MDSRISWIGIVGGMGTTSGMWFEQKFFKLCNKMGNSGDQDYPQWIYINASQIPDRTKAILGKGPDCTQSLIEAIKKAQLAGASVIVVICNTAHYYYERIMEQVSIPWIHLQHSTAQYVRTAFPETTQFGILATYGTLYAKLYSQAFERIGISAIEPPLGSKIQQSIMQAIYDQRYGIKYTGDILHPKARDLLLEAIEDLSISPIVAGCTELSFAFSQMDMPVVWVDPLDVAAEILYKMYYR